MTKLSMREREVLLIEKFGCTKEGVPQHAPLEHEKAQPGAVPVPEPVNTPPLSGREARSLINSARPVDELAQAVALLDELAVPSDPE